MGVFVTIGFTELSDTLFASLGLLMLAMTETYVDLDVDMLVFEMAR